jgi:hypothetical protein
MYERMPPFLCVNCFSGVLVACMGHYLASPRAHSVRLLNALYDGVDWQLFGPHDTAIAYAGQQLSIDVFAACAAEDAASVRVLVCGPPFDRSATRSVDHVLTIHAPSACTVQDAWVVAPQQVASTAADGSNPPPHFERSTLLQVRLNLAPFTRCGKSCSLFLK